MRDRAIAADVILAEIRGRRVTTSGKELKPRQKAYTWSLNNRMHVVQSNRQHSSCTRWPNEAFRPEEVNLRPIVVTMVGGEDRAFLQTCREIGPHQELFTNYGFDYDRTWVSEEENQELKNRSKELWEVIKNECKDREKAREAAIRSRQQQEARERKKRAAARKRQAKARAKARKAAAKARKTSHGGRVSPSTSSTRQQ